MKRVLLACIAIAALAAIVAWLTGRQPDAGVPERDPARFDLAQPSRSTPPHQRVDERNPASADAGSQDNRTSGDPLEPWSGIPVDQQGRSLGSRTKYFNRALISESRGNLAGCVAHIKMPNAAVNVELFAEAREGSMLVKYARVEPDAGLDLFAARCVEAAFERVIPLEQPDVAPGRLYRFSYPIVVNAQFDDVADGGA